MSKVKRIVVMVLVLSLALSIVLAGCTSNGGKKATEETSTNVNTQNAEDAQKSETQELKPVTLKWFYVADTQADQDKVFEEANKLVNEKINATVDFQPIDMGSYGEKLKVIIATGEVFDICWTSSWLNSYVDNALKAAYYPLDDLMATYAPTLKASIADKYWDATKLRDGGNIYAVPNMQYIAFTPALAFRKDLVDKYNLGDAINNIKTYNDLDPILKTIKDNEPNVYPFFYQDIQISDESNYQVAMPGAPLYAMTSDPSLKLLTAPELPSFVEGWKAARNFYNKGYIPKDALAMKNDLTNLVKAGKVFSTGAWYKPGVETELKNQYNGIDFVVKATTPTYVDPIQVRPTMNAISRTSPNPERAIMFLELMNTDKKLYNLLVHGIENTHYTKLEGDYIEPIKDTKYGVFNWVMGSVFNDYLLKGDASDKWEQTKKSMEEAKQTPTSGLALNLDALKNELAQIDSVVKEFYDPLQYGVVDTDATLAKYSDKLKKAGIDTVKAEVQKQLDAWLAQKAKK